MAGLIVSCFGVSRKTRVERLEGVSDEGLYQVASGEDGVRESSLFCGEKSKRSKNYETNEISAAKPHGFSGWTTTWKEKLTSGRRQLKANDESAFSCSVITNEKEGDICKCMQRWNIKTGKEIKSDSTQTSYETVDKRPFVFVNELGPTKPSNIYAYQSYMQSCDPALLVEDAQDSGVLTNHVNLNVSRGNAWEKAKSHSTVKSTVSDFFSRLHRTKKTKVTRIRI